MKSELIVDVQPQEIAVALTEDDRLQEISRERRDKDNYSVGNIYYGRVKKVMPALNAVFVDVGYEKEAFLHYLDLGSEFLTLQSFVSKAVSDRRHAPSVQRIQRQPEVGKDGHISDYLKVGDPILVQVSKEPINTKGPRLTAEISIAGRNMVLIPFGDTVMVSQKIRRESERSRLKQLVQSIKPQGFGVIVRTVAEDKRVAELDNELRLLVQRWEEIVKSLQQKEPVSLVCEELERTIGIIRDVFTPDFATIQVNDRAMYEEVRRYVELISPESAKIVKLYEGTQPIFDRFDITRQIKTGMGRVVGFRHGGYLIIDRTEALFSIDVNSGSKKLYEDQEENAFQFNMLAAEELVHQLRLRDIGGIIIVDFIDMDSKDHQQQLYDYVRKLMGNDRAKHNVLPLSKFGLMQITRQRVRPAVEMEVMEVCPTCMGKGKIQPSILFTDSVKQELECMSEHYGSGIRLHLHPYVYSYICRGWLLSLKNQWQRKYGVRIIEDQSLGMLEMRFVDAKGNILKHPEEPEQKNTVSAKGQNANPQSAKNGQNANQQNAKNGQNANQQNAKNGQNANQQNAKNGQPRKEQEEKRENGKRIEQRKPAPKPDNSPKPQATPEKAAKDDRRPQKQAPAATPAQESADSQQGNAAQAKATPKRKPAPKPKKEKAVASAEDTATATTGTASADTTATDSAANQPNNTAPKKASQPRRSRGKKKPAASATTAAPAEEAPATPSAETKNGEKVE